MEPSNLFLSSAAVNSNRKGAKITKKYLFYVIPQGSLQLSVQLSQARAKILTG
jgi:hypothetical protein